MAIKYIVRSLAFIALVLASCKQGPESPVETGGQVAGLAGPVKPRTIITTDGEIDDVDSFVRMLLYANEFDIEGLVYSSSQWHYKGDGKGTSFTSAMPLTARIYGERTNLRWPGEMWMQELIGAYGEVYPNLSQHAEGFPAPDYLLSLIRVGNIDFEGEMEVDTEGSDFIREKLLDDDDSPLYLQVWGGTNTIARALKSIQDEFGDSENWDAIYQKVCRKSIIYAILDQDATYRKYIEPNWPDLKIFYNSNQFWCFAYPWKRSVPEPWHHYLEGPFMKEHIIKGHGPLLEKYYSYGDGQQQAGDPDHIHGVDLEAFNEGQSGQQWGPFGRYDFISEGDSPAYLHLMDVGLDNLENPSYGGWGGRLVQSDTMPNRWEDGAGASDFNPFRDSLDATYPQTRWVPVIQQDFAGRADWCVLDYESANHPPTVQVAEGTTLSASPGTEISLTGTATDPDGDNLVYSWWQYGDVDTYPGKVLEEPHTGAALTFSLPADMQLGQDLHMILEVRDQAEHPMTRYRRVVITAE